MPGVGLEELTSLGIKFEQAATLAALINDCLAETRVLSRPLAWKAITINVLTPQQPFGLHQLLLSKVQAGWNTQEAPFPLWTPYGADLLATNLAKFMVSLKGKEFWRHYQSGNPVQNLGLLHKLSCTQPEQIWPLILERLNLRFDRPPDRVVDSRRGHEVALWLPGSELNIAYAALAGDGNSTAITWATEAEPTCLHRVSLGDLRQQCTAVAANLRLRGILPGDAVSVILPMTVEAVVIFLGIVLAGCVVCPIADSFSASEISVRLRIAAVKFVFTQDVVERGGKQHNLHERVASATAEQQLPSVVLPHSAAQGVLSDLRANDCTWHQFLTDESWRGGSWQPYVAASDTTICILFSSGTTGDPKAIPWTHTTPIRCGVDAWANLDLRADDTIAWPTNLGWMMGPWLIFAALLNRATMAIFQGSPLDKAFGSFVGEAAVNHLGVVPTIVAAWRRSGCMTGVTWPQLRSFASSGEASSPVDYMWLMSLLRYRAPVLEYCGGTELGGSYLSGTMLQPQAPTYFSMPSLGSALVLLSSDGRQSPHLTDAATPFTGEVALAPPMLGSSQRLLNHDHHQLYFQGMPWLAGGGPQLRRHGDEVQRLSSGYYRVLGRTDDTMNLGGIKVSSIDLERVCKGAVPQLIEAAAVAAAPPGGGPDQLVLFAVLQKGAALDENHLLHKCQVAIRQHMNPLFKLQEVILMSSLPRTSSNKLMRRVLRDKLQMPRMHHASKL